MPAIQREANGPSFQIRLFGRMEVLHSERPAPVRVPGKAQELLAYLILHPNREHRREHLAEVLWGRQRSDHARKNLRHALWVLREALDRTLPGTGLLRCDGAWVRGTITDALWIDVHEFERALGGATNHQAPPLAAEVVGRYAGAVDLHRSDLLEGWDGAWCVAPRERLRGKCVEILDALMGHFEAMQDHPHAAQAATRALELDPARETAHRTLMRALAVSRDRAGALRQYGKCEAVLKREFGAAPEAETRALYEAIRRGEGS